MLTICRKHHHLAHCFTECVFIETVHVYWNCPCLLELFYVYLSGWRWSFKENPSSKQLSKDASHWPHVNSSVVVLTASQQLRSTVVLSDHLQSHGDGEVRLNSTGKPKVTDLEETVTVYEQVPRLQVPVNDASRVEILQSCACDRTKRGHKTLNVGTRIV